MNKVILNLIDELINEVFESYCENNSFILAQNIKQAELQQKRDEIENLLDSFEVEIRASENHNCEEERAQLVGDYECDIEILQNEISNLRATMREFLGRLTIDLELIEKEAYND